MNQKDEQDLFIRIQKYINSLKGQKEIQKVIKEYIEKNFVDIQDLKL